MPLTVGSRLGHYDVTALIGEGGMGQVYQATDTKLNRQVALKILPEAFATDPDRLARFQREAQVLASLNHPNIAAIHGLEESEGTRALVLELVEGPTLVDRISQGPIPLDEALPIAKQIAEALEAAHEAGVIHRDLKPANIKVRDDGTVKVLDFGLAKAFQPDASDVSASMSPTISLTAAATQMGMVIGTAAYMAPEQASGKAVDKRADVWAFGVVVYEMLTGTRPFAGDDVSKTLARVIAIDPDWSTLPKDVPPVLGTFLHGCLEKNPKQRVQAIGDVRLAMEGAFETPAISAPGPVPAAQLQIWQRPVPLMFAAVALLAIVASLAVWSLTRPVAPPPPQLARFVIPLAADQSFTNNGRRQVTLSPDGDYVVYNANGRLRLRPIDQLEATAIPGTDGGRPPFFSPDGQWLGFWAGGELKRVATSGGAPVTLGSADLPFGVSWGDDDMIVYGQGPDGIWRVPGTGGTPEQVITVEEGEQAHGPQMLPGGEWLLFTFLAGSAQWDQAQIVVQSLVTDERVVLIEGGRDARYLPTGHLVYALDGVLLAVPFDLGSRRVTGGPVPLVEDVAHAPNQTGATHFSVADNGSLVYVPVGPGVIGTRTLVWVDREGREEPLGAPPRTYVQPRISPDGTRVVIDVRDQEQDLWIWDLTRETLTRFTFDLLQDWYPVWTPNGQRIAFSSFRAGGFPNMFWKAADGTGEAELLAESPNVQFPHGFSPDGMRLLFRETNPGTETDLVVLSMEGDRSTEPLLATEFNERNPELSP